MDSGKSTLLPKPSGKGTKKGRLTGLTGSMNNEVRTPLDQRLQLRQPAFRRKPVVDLRLARPSRIEESRHARILPARHSGPQDTISGMDTPLQTKPRTGNLSFDRITFDPEVMGGKPCIRGMRVTVGTILGLLAAGYNEARILEAYPYLESEDIRQSLVYATWRAEEREVPLERSA